MQRVHDDTVITLLQDDLPDSASRSYVKEHKTTQVPKEQQKGKSFGSTQTMGGEFPKVGQGDRKKVKVDLFYFPNLLAFLLLYGVIFLVIAVVVVDTFTVLHLTLAIFYSLLSLAKSI